VAVGLTPEMLPMIVTVNLAKGALTTLCTAALNPMHSVERLLQRVNGKSPTGGKRSHGQESPARPGQGDTRDEMARFNLE